MFSRFMFTNDPQTLPFDNMTISNPMPQYYPATIAPSALTSSLMISAVLIRPMPPLLDPGTPCRTTSQTLTPRCTIHSSRLWPPPLARVARAQALLIWGLFQCLPLQFSMAMSLSHFITITRLPPSPRSTPRSEAARVHRGRLLPHHLVTLLVSVRTPQRLEPRRSAMVEASYTATAATRAPPARHVQLGVVL